MRAPFVSRVAPLVLAGLAVVAGLTLILLTLNRGFDWTDESFVSTMIASDRYAEGEVWGFQHLLHPLFVAVGEKVLAFRVLRLIGYLALSVLLVRVGVAVAGRLGLVLRRSEWWWVLLVAQIGTLSAWSYAPRYLGYNELTSWLAQAGCALMVLGILATRRSWVTWVTWVVVGAILPLLAFAKVTAAIIYVPLLLLAMVPPSQGLRRWERLVAAVLGAGGMLGVLALAGLPVATYLPNALDVLTDSSAHEASNHSLAAMVTAYLDSLRLTAVALAVPIALTLVLVALLLWAAMPGLDRARAQVLRVTAWGVAALLVVALFLLPVPRSWDLLGAGVTFTGVGAAAVLGMLALGGHRWRAEPDRPARPTVLHLVVVALLVVAAPFVSAAGTNNPLLGQLFFSSTTWAVLLGLSLVALHRASGTSHARGIPLLLGAALVWLFVWHVNQEIRVHPYRSVPYLAQQFPTVVEQLAGIRMTKAQAELATWLHEVAESEQADGVPAASIGSPGALFAFNRSGWANPWIAENWSISYDSVERACAHGAPADLFVLQPAEEDETTAPYRHFAEALRACGLDFPGDFTAVAELPPRTPGAEGAGRVKPPGSGADWVGAEDILGNSGAGMTVWRLNG